MFVSCNRIDNPIGTDLSWVFIEWAYRSLKAGTDDLTGHIKAVLAMPTMMRVIDGTTLETMAAEISFVDNASDVLKSDWIRTLISSEVLSRSNPPMRGKLRIVPNAEYGMGIADIDGQEHDLFLIY